MVLSHVNGCCCSVCLTWSAYPSHFSLSEVCCVFQMLDQYKLEYATYLESLPEDKRQEELLNNQPKRKPAALKPPSSKTATKSNKINVSQ